MVKNSATICWSMNPRFSSSSSAILSPVMSADMPARALQSAISTPRINPKLSLLVALSTRPLKASINSLAASGGRKADSSIAVWRTV